MSRGCTAAVQDALNVTFTIWS